VAQRVTSHKRAQAPDMVRLREVNERLGIGRTTSYEWIKQGIYPIPVRQIGTHWLARRVDVEAFFGSGCQRGA
jgi:excisionase family DNA binding protein